VQKEFKKHLESTFQNLLSDHFLLACSGGLDSVVLAHLCHTLKLDFSIAHCNFQLRGAASDADEEFVTKLANKLNVIFYVNHFKTNDYVILNKVNVQIAARDLRYAWFTELMQENQIPTLVTAHHADDNLETFLINLSRGTGIDGLTGIPAKTDTISRPLLAFSRAQILAYARANKLEWVEDKSNSDTKYLRNKIRHEIIPQLKELHPTFSQNFELTRSHLKGSSEVLSNHIELLKSRIFQMHQNGFRIAISELEVLYPQKAYLHALLKEYGFTAWNDITRLLAGMSGKEIRSKTHRLVKDREHLLLEVITEETDEKHLIEEGQMVITVPVNIVIELVGDMKDSDSHILYADKDSLKYPLVVRKWEKGDYFYPLGMTGKKKLSKYFKDEKIDVISKEKQWLLCSGKEIVWVIGRRSDRRHAISKETKQIVKFTLHT
jgi:tRNA(Ile)-lysidine synthase